MNKKILAMHVAMIASVPWLIKVFYQKNKISQYCTKHDIPIQEDASFEKKSLKTIQIRDTSTGKQ